MLSFAVNNIERMSKSELESALRDNKTFHVITLTRNQAQDGFYLPITASEAVTVFVVVNFWDEEDKLFDTYITKTILFDQSIFEESKAYLVKRKT